MGQQNIKKYFLSFPEKIYFFTQYKIHAEMSQKYTDFVKKTTMQLILLEELCSEMSSRMIFWPNKTVCTLIWIPSKYTQMSLKPHHYLEPCHKGEYGSKQGLLPPDRSNFEFYQGKNANICTRIL